MTPIRVAIVDDHPIFREGLRSTLDRSELIDVVSELSSGEEALDALASTEVDVAIMDLHMPGIGGIEAIRQLTIHQPDLAIVVLTMQDDEASIRDAIRAGARGYVLKDADRDEIVRAIEAAVAHTSVLPAGAALLLAKGLAIPPPDAVPFPELTSREREVLAHLARGLTNAQIAAELHVNDKTVRNHLTNVFVKLGVSDRGHAIVLARDEGLHRSLD